MGWRSCGSADRMEPAGEDMMREGSCARTGVCDIAVSGHGEADVGMPAANGQWFDATLAKRALGARRSVSPTAGGTCRGSRSGGKMGNQNVKPRAHRPSARCHIDRAKRRSSCCPAHQSPLQSHRAACAMPCLSLVVFVPFTCPVTMNEIHDTADLPLDRLTIDLDPHCFPRDNLRPPAQISRYPSHSDETCAKRGVCAARKVRANKQYMSGGGVQHLLAVRFVARAPKDFAI